jgi:hypothetical protein
MVDSLQEEQTGRSQRWKPADKEWGFMDKDHKSNDSPQLLLSGIHDATVNSVSIAEPGMLTIGCLNNSVSYGLQLESTGFAHGIAFGTILPCIVSAMYQNPSQGFLETLYTKSALNEYEQLCTEWMDHYQWKTIASPIYGSGFWIIGRGSDNAIKWTRSKATL